MPEVSSNLAKPFRHFPRLFMDDEILHATCLSVDFGYIFTIGKSTSSMNKNDLNQALTNIRPCTILVSDGRSIYVDNPETVLLSDTVLVVGTHGQGRVVKELAIIALA